MKNKVKRLLIIGAVVNVVLGSTVFPLVKTTVIKAISQQTYMTGDWISLVILMMMTKMFTKKEVRDSLVNKHIYKIMIIDLVLYVLVLGYSLNGNIEFRYIAVCLLSATTTFIWTKARAIYMKKIFKGEELIDLESKIEHYAMISAVVGGAVGIGIAYLKLSYAPLCLAQIIIVIIMTWFDYITFQAFKKIPVEA